MKNKREDRRGNTDLDLSSEGETGLVFEPIPIPDGWPPLKNFSPLSASNFGGKFPSKTSSTICFRVNNQNKIHSDCPKKKIHS